MSVILGIYSKSKNINKNEVKEVLKDFSLNGKRKLQTKKKNRVIFSALKQYGYGNIAENENKSSVILFGGRIYDFKEGVSKLIRKGHRFKNKKSCAEFVLHSYEEFGESFLKKINGIFSFAIYDEPKDELILANDSFGIHPMFIYNSGDYIIFSSEYHPLVRYHNFDKKLDYNAIVEYFTLGTTLGDKTFFESIKNLHQGSLLKTKGDKSYQKQYDLLDIKIPKNKKIDYFAGRLANIVNKATQSRAENPGEIACDLSGGADTRLILSNLTERQRHLTKFATNQSAYLKEKEDMDVFIAKRIAGMLNLNLKVRKSKPNVKEFGEHFFEKRPINNPKKVRLTGTFGGEFLGGCCFEKCPIQINKINDKEIRQSLKKIFTNHFLEKISDPLVSLKKELQNIKAENKELYFAIHQFTRGFFTRIYGGSRSGMGSLSPCQLAIESRESVFWDSRFLKVLLTVPKEFLVDYNVYNQIYKKHFPELTNVPTNSGLSDRKDSCMEFIGSGTEPKKVKKPRYSKALQEYLKSSDTWDKKFFNKEYALSESKRKCKNYSFYDTQSPFIKSFIDFEAWYRAFVLNPKSGSKSS
ncbi:hypothetical protein JW707_01270 [Candidatus Woesearchaeota archaeon]|nr:hypothetical protein [Candidatus Woesearchaeota archaeon]